MAQILQKLLAWLERNAHRQRERAIETYLSQASDLADLKNRLRNLERAI